MAIPESARRFVSAILPALLVALAVRLLYLAIIPSYAYSWDMTACEKVASVLAAGGNPYAETTFLNWPPLWMCFIFVMRRIADLTSIPFLQVLRIFLFVAELIAMVLAALLARSVAPQTSLRTFLLVSFALNPIPIFLTTQHGHFDAMVVCWIVAALLALLAYRRSGDPLDWMLACLLLGMGILAKTIPVALAPLLIPGARLVARRARLLGAVLLFGPAALGTAVIFVLSPQQVLRHVLLYSAVPGRFGISGITKAFGMTWAMQLWGAIAPLLLVPLFAWGCIRAWKWTPAGNHQVVLLSGLILLAIPTIGPGFGPQYAIWFVPSLAVSYLSGSRQWRVMLAIAFAITSATYVVFYGFAWDLGQSIFFLWDSPIARFLGASLTKDAPRTWVTLPMWLSWIALLAAGIRELRRPFVAGETIA